jgi:hypothetical protein
MLNDKINKAVAETAKDILEAKSPFDKDYKSQLDQPSAFEKKKISTGTVYSRKPVKDEEPKVVAKKKKTFSEMLDVYATGGLKSLEESLIAQKEEQILDELNEEPTNDEFTKEIKDAQDKSQGKGKKAEVAKASVQAVEVQEENELDEELKGNQHKIDKNKNGKVDAEDFKILRKEETELEESTTEKSDDRKQIERQRMLNKLPKKPKDEYEVKVEKYLKKKYNKEEVETEDSETLDERHLTDAEMEKREKNVKSMKKNLSGFKSRYGDRAKEVMYATATKQAKGE